MDSSDSTIIVPPTKQNLRLKHFVNAEIFVCIKDYLNRKKLYSTHSQ